MRRSRPLGATRAQSPGRPERGEQPPLRPGEIRLGAGHPGSAILENSWPESKRLDLQEARRPRSRRCQAPGNDRLDRRPTEDRWR